MRSRSGFTLIELIVVILIVGILASFAVPNYITGIENNKAQHAVSLLRMIAAANRQYAVNHDGVFSGGAEWTNANCNVTPPNPCDADPNNSCNLVLCRYVQPQNWDNLPYRVAAARDIGAFTFPEASIAAVQRRASAASPYSGWGYSISQNNVITVHSGAPTPLQ